MDIKPIETRFDGHRFRSRLEARWAVFFKELRIPYEYELQGFELPSGKRYLPDFWLPHLQLHVEVKPTREIFFQSAIKIEEFAVKTQDNPTLLIIGTPGNHEMFLLSRKTVDGCAESVLDPFPDDSDPEEDMSLHDYWDNIETFASVQFASDPLRKPSWRIVLGKGSVGPWELKCAILAAKGSRFEYGESGAESNHDSGQKVRGWN